MYITVSLGVLSLDYDASPLTMEQLFVTTHNK